ncbi:MAG: ethanolamine ammonia-lyase subunit EutC [Roseomonas sp.]|nr:ethanolamine ammonia-lyase subunit EutC [Roseomonas sp.]MCA3342296.1 ethanolamine ammonia-lyase subunit EutC [Roseomonas sp.]
MSPPVKWRDLRRFTDARVALGRVGNALPTAAHLDFQEAHARARDAVWSSLDVTQLEAALAPLGLPLQRVTSQAEERRRYLLRPDLGRRLAEDSTLPQAKGSIALVVADGLCARGVQQQAPALLAALVPALSKAGFAPSPIIIAEQARVALGDDVAEAMHAAAVVVLIGERPGLSATDSMGLYITWAARRGSNDAMRNCISNIRPGGLGADVAAAKALWLLAEARKLGATGVALKDEMPSHYRLT